MTEPTETDPVVTALQLFKAATAQYETAHGFFEDLIEAMPKARNESEAYIAAAVGFASLMLSQAPSESARIRVQLLAHELCLQHGVDLGEDVANELRRAQLKVIRTEDPERYETLDKLGAIAVFEAKFGAIDPDGDGDG